MLLKTCMTFLTFNYLLVAIFNAVTINKDWSFKTKTMQRKSIIQFSESVSWTQAPM